MNGPSAIAQVLGAAFDDLAAEVRTVHSGRDLTTSGQAEAFVGANPLSALICLCFGLPRQGTNQPVSVRFLTGADGRDRWWRNFAGRKYSSTLAAGVPGGGIVIERQGTLTNIFHLTVENRRLAFRLVGFAVLGVPMPGWLRPRCVAYESGAQGQFTFDITVDMPVIGRLIQYRGTMDVPA
jgi:hypothetical protein